MRTSSLIILSVVAMLGGCKKTPTPDRQPVTEPQVLKIERPTPTMNEVQARIFNTNVSEDLILSLTPRLKLIAQKFEGATVDLRSLFDANVNYLGPDVFDVSPSISSQPTDQNHLVAHFSWPLQASPVETADAAETLWAPILANFTFSDTQFGIIAGYFLDDADVFRMTTAFEGRFLDPQQRPFGAKAKQTLDWRIVNNQWRISSWIQHEVEFTHAPKTLFANVTGSAVPDGDTLETITRSQHEERLIARAKDSQFLKSFGPMVQYFVDWNSLFQYTSVSVVDLDQDGWDDLFVLDRWGESVLLRNQGDGTFKDVSNSCGLKLDETFANCALFADFDNDGDSDVLIGRTLEPSLFFRNDDGQFVPDQQVNRALSDVRFVSSGSVIDVNGDGLLDVYLSTYCTRGGTDLRWIEFTVPPNEQAMMRSKVANSHSFLDRAGPPNVLLMNKGGKLRKVPIDDTLKQWRVSFQSVWTDIDDDGDPDLYLCNDFSPDVFLRNDTKQGTFRPKFTDITDQVFPGGSMGFGMGASLGDYNSDGKLDLYVSNMYSKAGHRVIQNFDGDVDPRIAVSAKGNFLYANVGGRFEQVAGVEDGKQHVSKVGWSFGGQLADLNNDGRLDLYVPSGFFTAPDSIEGEADL